MKDEKIKYDNNNNNNKSYAVWFWIIIIFAVLFGLMCAIGDVDDWQH